MVGRLSRIRVSSVTLILPPRTSVGTLKSTRSSTRFPRTSKSSTESFAIILGAPVCCYRSVREHFQHFDTAIAVSPLIIVPADDFYEAIADCQRQLAIEYAGVRIANNVLGNEGLIAKLKH